MTIEGIVGGLIALGIGLLFAFYGYRLFLILLPIWGFFAGFVLGAGAMTALFGEGFLVTVTSWVAGLIVGVLFAVLSYLYYWFAVVFVGAWLGYTAGIGLMTLLGIGDGFLAFVVDWLSRSRSLCAVHLPARAEVPGPGRDIFQRCIRRDQWRAVAARPRPAHGVARGTIGALRCTDNLSWIWAGRCRRWAWSRCSSRCGLTTSERDHLLRLSQPGNELVGRRSGVQAGARASGSSRANTSFDSSLPRRVRRRRSPAISSKPLARAQSIAGLRVDAGIPLDVRSARMIRSAWATSHGPSQTPPGGSSHLTDSKRRGTRPVARAFQRRVREPSKACAPGPTASHAAPVQ